MNGQKLHEILICTDPDCGFRFPLSPSEKRLERCPRCGAPVTKAEVPYRSFSVPVKQKPSGGKLFVSVLDNIRSAYNVGSIFRTADGSGIRKLFLCGITPTPDNPKVGKTALDAEKAIPWEHSWSVLETVEKLLDGGFYVISLEGGAGSENIFTALPAIKESEMPIALVVGNEVSGVDPEAVRISSKSVYIPMEGIKESLNVATAFGIASYLIRYQGMNNE